MPRKSEDKKPKGRPSSDPQAREQQLVNLAVNLAEQQLMDGTASPSVINHFLKIASSRETIEREILEKQAKLIEAKALSISKDREAEEIAKKAIEAMKNYNSGS
jgi:hypothetical protein